MVQLSSGIEIQQSIACNVDALKAFMVTAAVRVVLNDELLLRSARVLDVGWNRLTARCALRICASVAS